MTLQWSWVMVGTGAAAATVAAARTCSYLLRQHMRARATAVMARELSIRGARAEVSDRDSTAWSARLDGQEPQ